MYVDLEDCDVIFNQTVIANSEPGTFRISPAPDRVAINLLGGESASAAVRILCSQIVDGAPSSTSPNTVCIHAASFPVWFFGRAASKGLIIRGSTGSMNLGIVQYFRKRSR